MKTAETTPKSTMTTADNGPTGPIEFRDPNLLKNEPQRQPSRMIVDLEGQPAGGIEAEEDLAVHQQDPPGYQPRKAEDNGAALKAVDNEQAAGVHESEFLDTDDFYENDTSSETEQSAQLVAWVDSPGNATDIVAAHSSDDYRDDNDDIGDDDDDEDDDEEDDDIEDDEENFSDDTDEHQETVGKEYPYTRPIHRGPYKSRRDTEQLRKIQGRPGTMRKRPLRLKSISGTRQDTAPNSGAPFAPVQDTSLQSTSPRQHLAHICEEVTGTLHQGKLEQLNS